MINSIEIPNNINLKILKNNDTYIVLLKKLNQKLFIICKSDIFYNNRILLSNKYNINLIKQSINNLNLWNKRKIILKGVGSKAELDNNLLKIKVSNTLKIYNIPKDISIKILNSPLTIILWGRNINVIDKFRLYILKNLPKKLK